MKDEIHNDTIKVAYFFKAKANCYTIVKREWVIVNRLIRSNASILLVQML